MWAACCARYAMPAACGANPRRPNPPAFPPTSRTISISTNRRAMPPCSDRDVGRVLRPVRNAGRMWSEPATAESAGFSTDEQNNIDIYKSARDATVFITSTVYTRSFFGVYPEKGTGTGFVISPEGEILTNNHVAGGGSQLTGMWSEPATAESAGFSTDEQNNIDIYKSARGATVFITSTVYTRSFFGVYPEKLRV